MNEIIVDGRKAKLVGLTQENTILFADDREYVFEPTTQNDFHVSDLIEIATVSKDQNHHWLLNGVDLENWIVLTTGPRLAAKRGIPEQHRSPGALRKAYDRSKKDDLPDEFLRYAYLLPTLNTTSESVKGVAWFQNDEYEPVLLKRFHCIAKTTALNPIDDRITFGKLTCANDYQDVTVDHRLFDLRPRQAARFCIKFLVENKAKDADSARSLRDEIDPYVRKNTTLEPNPRRRIQDYFNGNPYRQLCSSLIARTGRIGRYFLKV